MRNNMKVLQCAKYTVRAKKSILRPLYIIYHKGVPERRQENDSNSRGNRADQISIGKKCLLFIQQIFIM
ncbi:hypothetical protein HNR53_001946 [Bacillus benzoevorans]|uniref:Uncharacterized protein n=1 Tax=Bacillus benzoevorans TaxID=1456 RepID=A0A7X0HQZ6_9BACI|nr:hypothetical protein [Bacillus benzoevorans]